IGTDPLQNIGTIQISSFQLIYCISNNLHTPRYLTVNRGAERFPLNIKGIGSSIPSPPLVGYWDFRRPDFFMKNALRHVGYYGYSVAFCILGTVFICPGTHGKSLGKILGEINKF
ncbi:unnamed protein product, partial [Allacma fusca]